MEYHKHKVLEEGLADFFHSCHSKFYPAKNIIIRPGDLADTLFLYPRRLRHHLHGK